MTPPHVVRQRYEAMSFAGISFALSAKGSPWEIWRKPWNVYDKGMLTSGSHLGITGRLCESWIGEENLATWLRKASPPGIMKCDEASPSHSYVIITKLLYSIFHTRWEPTLSYSRCRTDRIRLDLGCLLKDWLALRDVSDKVECIFYSLRKKTYVKELAYLRTSLRREQGWKEKRTEEM
jgi:hypothetical protein